jgi:heat shock protein HtpX
VFELVRKNRNRSILLVGSMLVLFSAIGWVAGEMLQRGAGPAGVAIAVVVGFFMFLVSFYSGGSVLLAAAGAHEVKKEDAPQLYNVVEEMVIASGLGSMPRVYVIESNAANAFATGRSPEVSAVAVTEGLLNILNRDELQAVMAHEIAHVKNRDILFMTLLMVMAGAIALIADVVSRYFWYGGGRRSRSSSSNGGQAQLVIFIIGIALLILGPVVARLIFFAVSRSREYMADASSAIFTRNPEALASALEKIAGNVAGTKLPVPKVAQPMLIVGPALFETHPPIEKRVGILRSLAGVGGELSYQRYANAFQEVTGARAGFVPKSALQERSVQAAARVPVIGATRPTAAKVPTGQQLIGAVLGGATGAAFRREALDAVKKAAGYEVHACACGAKIKIPASYPGKAKVRCLACGRALFQA